MQEIFFSTYMLITLTMFFITGMLEGLLRKQIKWNNEGKTVTGSGCKPTLSKQEESQSANIIVI